MKAKSPWRFNRKTQTLQLFGPRGNRRYCVGLRSCRTSAGVLDWIMQIAKKPWADDPILAGLVRDMNRLLNPQANLCSCGIEKGPINVAKVLAGERTLRSIMEGMLLQDEDNPHLFSFGAKRGKPRR